MHQPVTQERFHPSAQKYYGYAKNIIARGLEEKRITDDDAKLIQEYVGEIASTSSISAGRVFKLTSILTNWREYIRPYRSNTISDVYRGINVLRDARKKDGAPLTQNTRADYVKFLKRFYLWLIENKFSEIEEKKIRKITPPSPNLMTKTAEQLLTGEEIEAMLKKCRTSRDRALISMLYEGGFRISELGTLRWKQVKVNEWNVAINVNGKTEKTRYIPLVMSKSYLAQWGNEYPGGAASGESFVFLTDGKNIPLQYRGIAKQLAIIAKRAGIKKHITTHIFRHSRITHLMQQGYSESVIKKMMWGNITTKMFATYAHLTDSDIDDEIARKQG
ncbi:tyrosine-type recombinase/integrase, partial [Methanoregula sp.]|uniref:tyrosine-type recombinase/integrase n=1 Tax=Methanoregula sp. TaxID=2052170 RepID=UPI000CB56EB9